MPEADLIALFVEPLNRLQIRYLVSGSVASMLYGEPRVTHDIDLILILRPENVRQLGEAFPASDFYTPPPEVVEVEVAREHRGHFTVIHLASGLKADCYTSGRDPLHAWAFSRAQRYAVGALNVQVAPPEYVILRKLEYYREGGSGKHLRDIRGMLDISGDLIDRTALAGWVARRRLEVEWQTASASPEA
ncbi:MAG: hypothetical protein H7A47_15250 [Verrucomicrobiales bacterium]|nr:hypothetical protein [Verrucomicrobiales bacterium]